MLFDKKDSNLDEFRLEVKKKMIGLGGDLYALARVSDKDLQLLKDHLNDPFLVAKEIIYRYC